MSGRDNLSYQPDTGSVSLKVMKVNGEFTHVGEHGKNHHLFAELNAPTKSYSLPIEDAKDLPTDVADDDDEEKDYSLCSLLPCYHTAKKSQTLRRVAKGVFLGILVVLYFIYFVIVLMVTTKIEQEDYWCKGDGFLIILTSIGAVGLLYFQIIKPFFGKFLYENVLRRICKFLRVIWSFRVFRYAFYLCLIAVVGVFLYFDTREESHRLVSLFGIVVLLLFGFLFSKAPRKVCWSQIIWGLALQFILGLIVLRWRIGKAIFKCAGDKVSTFLAFTDMGSALVFGDDLVRKQFVFAFTALPVISFFSFCIQILYYFGVMQWVVIKLGWFLQITIGTTACESVNAAANIFLGQTEAPLLIKPYIPDMTRSELHAVMTGGFSTIAGTVMAAYIAFGVDPTHLLSASVMSAPAALAFAKLFYPETQKTLTGAKSIKIIKGEETNWLHAGLVGVINSITLIANIAVNLIAFYAFISFISTVFNWGCTLAGAEDGVCTLESIFGYIFTPLAWVMGVEWSECGKVGELIGLKTIANEFIAYSKLSEFKKNNELSARAEIIATYALCGFSNISSIGINMGGIGAIAPSRRSDLAKVVVRAMIAGCCACFLTACIAGIFLSDETEFGIESTVTPASNFTN